MFRVKCSLPNASSLINGVEFEQAVGGGMISVAVEQKVAAQFRGIPGYEIVREGGKAGVAQTEDGDKSDGSTPAGAAGDGGSGEAGGDAEKSQAPADGDSGKGKKGGAK